MLKEWPMFVCYLCGTCPTSSVDKQHSPSWDINNKTQLLEYCEQGILKKKKKKEKEKETYNQALKTLPYGKG